MIPRTYPTLIDGRKAGYMRVFYLTSVTGLTKWIDYIPVKTVAFSAAAEGTTNANGHINVVQVASSTALRRWVDYIPVFEDGAATVPWSTNANGYIPVDQMLDLDFRAGILDSRITFTRADAVTCATYFDSTGRMQTAAANVARFDYDPATAASGVELVSNGTFPTDVSGWSVEPGGAVSWSAGTLQISGAGFNAYQAIPVTAGQAYEFLYTPVTNGSQCVVAVGSAVGGGELFSRGSATTAQTVRVYPTTSTIYISIKTLGSAATFDNISLKQFVASPRGLLIEESRQNLLLQSRDMTQAAWTKTDVTPARTQVGIDGVANTACLMTEGTLLTAETFQASAAMTAGSTVTGSVVLKRGNTDWLRVRILDNATGVDGVNAWVNLSTGAKGTVTALGTGTNASSTIQSLGGGWYRFSVTCTPSGTAVAARLHTMSASADNSTTRVSGATYIVDCAQLEVGAFATSIIPTTTTALTRAADVATISGANFSSWWNATQGTLVVEFDRPAISAVGLGYNQVIAGATSASGMGVDLIGVMCGAGSPAAQRFDVISASVSQASLTYANGTAGTVYKAAGSWIVNDAIGSQNGTLTAPDTVLTVPTVDRFFIGHSAGSAQGVSHIRSLRYYPTRLANATLQALTA